MDRHVFGKSEVGFVANPECEGQCLKEVKHGRTTQEEEND